MTTKGYRLLLGCSKLVRKNGTVQVRAQSTNLQQVLKRNRVHVSPTCSRLNSSGVVLRSLLNLNPVASLSTQVPRPYNDPELSYSFGKSNEHLIYSTVDREFHQRTELMPDEVAFISHAENRQVTLRQLNRDVNKLAKAMVQQFNISKGDYVGVFAHNCYQWVVIQFACSRIGAILTPINPSYKSNELAFILKKGMVKCLFLPGPKSNQSELNNHLEVLQSDRIVAAMQAGELQLKNVILLDENIEYSIESVSSNHSDTEKRVQSLDGHLKFKLANCKLHNWSSTTSNDGVVFRSIQEAEEAKAMNSDSLCILDPYSVSPDDPFAVYYTSGTTGTPKGACISQFTVINNARFCQFRLRHGRPRDWKATCTTTLPMFHIFAGVLNTLGPILANTKIVYSSYKYDIKAFVDAILENQSNLVTLTPTILIDMLTYIETNKLTDVPLKIIQSGGAALSPEVVSRTFKTLPNLEECRTGYGSTENGSVATFQTCHEPAETRAFSVGPPLDFTEVRIVKPNTDQLLRLGEKGEVQTRGFNTMIEYLGDPEKTSDVITANRWYKTGDIGYMYPHGSVQICGRLKSLIIKGGENIYPEEVEQLIHTLNYVEDVHVVGVPDKRFGEQVCAWIKLKPGFREATNQDEASSAGGDSSKLVRKEDIIKYCRENITYFKVPKYLLFVNEFPMTPTKKVQGHLMTEASIKILGLQDQLS